MTRPTRHRRRTRPALWTRADTAHPAHLDRRRRVRPEHRADHGDDVHPRVPAAVRAHQRGGHGRRHRDHHGREAGRRDQRPGDGQHRRHDPVALGQDAAVHPVLGAAGRGALDAAVRDPRHLRGGQARLLRGLLLPLGLRLHRVRRAVLGSHRLGLPRPEGAHRRHRARARVRRDRTRARDARDAVARTRAELLARDHGHGLDAGGGCGIRSRHGNVPAGLLQHPREGARRPGAADVPAAVHARSSRTRRC